MKTALEALSTATSRLDDATDAARAAAGALDGVSDKLAERVQEVARRLEDVRGTVARAADALEGAGA